MVRKVERGVWSIKKRVKNTLTTCLVFFPGMVIGYKQQTSVEEREVVFET